MKSNELNDFMIGKWQSGQRESEWGTFTMKITFNGNHEFKVESFFGESQEPIIIEGTYKVVESTLIATSWNNGKPIAVSTENNKLILEIASEPPLILQRN